jgi:phage shock protein E
MRFSAIPLVALSVLAVACGGETPAASTPSATPSASASASASVSAPAATTGVEHVDGAKAHQLVAAGAVLVDVRSADEYKDKHLDDAISVPLEEVASHDFGPKDKPLVFYCTAGHSSKQAAEALAARGYTHVYLLGAMSAWGK